MSGRRTGGEQRADALRCWLRDARRRCLRGRPPSASRLRSPALYVATACTRRRRPPDHRRDRGRHGRSGPRRHGLTSPPTACAGPGWWPTPPTSTRRPSWRGSKSVTVTFYDANGIETLDGHGGFGTVPDAGRLDERLGHMSWHHAGRQAAPQAQSSSTMPAPRRSRPTSRSSTTGPVSTSRATDSPATPTSPTCAPSSRAAHQLPGSAAARRQRSAARGSNERRARRALARLLAGWRLPLRRPSSAPGAATGAVCVFSLDHVGRDGIQQVVVGADTNYYAGGGVRLSCAGTSVRMASDSAGLLFRPGPEHHGGLHRPRAVPRLHSSPWTPTGAPTTGTASGGRPAETSSTENLHERLHAHAARRSTTSG